MAQCIEILNFKLLTLKNKIMTTQKKLTRSMSNRKIAGVCGGLGEYFNVDPLVFRIIFLVLLCGGGTGLLLYLVLWIVMPEDPIIISNGNAKKSNFEEVMEETIDGVFVGSSNKKCRRHSSGVFWGLLFVAFGFLWLGRSFGIIHFHWYNVFKLWPLLIIWVGITLLPIERLWKNVCSFIILAIALVLIFLLPSSSCCRHFWDDDFEYEIKRKFKNIECNVNDYSKNELVQKELRISEKIKGVIIEGPWEVTITQDDMNSSAEIEYNVPHSKITTEIRSNGYVYIRANSLGSHRNKTLNATINAAQLEKIKASGAATIKTHGQFFSDCNISLSGASQLDGFSCEGGNTNISLSGASKLKNFAFKGNRADIDISGASKIDILDMNLTRLIVSASGASKIYGEGSAAEISLTASGSSHFNFYAIESDFLDLSLSGASSAEVTVNNTIKGSLTGASTLKYKNTENVSGVSTTGGSKIIRVK